MSKQLECTNCHYQIEIPKKERKINKTWQCNACQIETVQTRKEHNECNFHKLNTKIMKIVMKLIKENKQSTITNLIGNE